MRDVSPAQHQYNCNARQYETLPPAAYIGQFDSGELNRRDSVPYSSLAIVWFQDDFALPIDASVQAQIERLDWEGWLGIGFGDGRGKLFLRGLL